MINWYPFKKRAHFFVLGKADFVSEWKHKKTQKKIN